MDIILQRAKVVDNGKRCISCIWTNWIINKMGTNTEIGESKYDSLNFNDKELQEAYTTVA